MVKSAIGTVQANPAALINTTLGLELSPTSGTVPFTVQVGGYLLRADNAAGVGGKTIYIYRRKQGTTTWTQIGTATTLSAPSQVHDKGWYGYADYLDVAAVYEYQSEFKGDSTYAGCESPLREVAEKKEPWGCGDEW